MDDLEDQDHQAGPNLGEIAADIYVMGVLQNHPNALLPHGQYASRLRQCCAFFACNFPAAEGTRFCSPYHAEVSQILSHGNLAYVVVDGYFDQVKELDLRNMLALLNKSEGIDVGIPTAVDEAVFSRVPWSLGFINMEFLHQEIKRDWVFFHTKTRPRFPTFVQGPSSLSWSRKNNYRHRYGDHQFTSSVSYLIHLGLTPNAAGDEDTEMLKAMLKPWTLHEHILNEQSIYCLSFSLDVLSPLCGTKRGKTDTVKVAPPESKRDKTVSGSKRKQSNDKTASASKQPRVGQGPKLLQSQLAAVNGSDGDGQIKESNLGAYEKEQELQLATEEESDDDSQEKLEALSRESIMGLLNAYEKDRKLLQSQLAAVNGSDGDGQIKESNLGAYEKEQELQLATEEESDDDSQEKLEALSRESIMGLLNAYEKDRKLLQSQLAAVNGSDGDGQIKESNLGAYEKEQELQLATEEESDDDSQEKLEALSRESIMGLLNAYEKDRKLLQSQLAAVNGSDGDGQIKESNLGAYEKEQELQLATEEESDDDSQEKLEALSRESIMGLLNAYEKDRKLLQSQLATKKEEAKSGSEKMTLGQSLNTTM